uniref:Uncharacterized protein n=1 Tax=Globisporangium ultimum (strain ATCC 200006 / CBS 805.95 / DAOM BR144) TaxID=431595 RepID=K3WBW9_GLOUD
GGELQDLPGRISEEQVYYSLCARFCLCVCRRLTHARVKSSIGNCRSELRPVARPTSGGYIPPGGPTDGTTAG